ncbi:hypothetical protein F2Q68_00041472 [Brassica cretica]|uniref:Arf-GAP domain-containing protein n=1 Tax=Brassica cretica TaxID=69181 RepID=A0A8S9MPK4_BRACR|nr:hypothetical protein F2Q68_00041472 [Brassica cretica]
MPPPPCRRSSIPTSLLHLPPRIRWTLCRNFQTTSQRSVTSLIWRNRARSRDTETGDQEDDIHGHNYCQIFNMTHHTVVLHMQTNTKRLFLLLSFRKILEALRNSVNCLIISVQWFLLSKQGGAGANVGGGGGGAPVKSKSSEDIYTRSQLEASAAGKESFFARRMAENESKPEGLPPSRGGKYVGFGSGSGPVPRSNQQDDVFSVVSQGFGRLSMVAASAASVVQTGTKEFTSKVKEGGYDHKVSETVNVVASKTTEIGQRTWGIMKGVMAIASQKVGEYTKEGTTTTWSQRNESESNGYYQNFGNGNKAANPSVEGRGSQSSSSGYYNNSQRSNSWDESKKKEAVASKGSSASNDDDGWTGWNDPKDDVYYQSAGDKKSAGHNGKSDTAWTGGGFH